MEIGGNEILIFPEEQGGQAVVGIGVYPAMERIEATKVGGVTIEEIEHGRLSHIERNLGIERIIKHEIDGLNWVGEKYSEFPSAHRSGVDEGHPYLHMSVGIERIAAKNGKSLEQAAREYLEDGRVMTWNQLLFGQGGSHSMEKRRKAIKELDCNGKIEKFLGIASPISKLHEEGIIHNDVKWSNFLSYLQEDGKEFTRCIDLGSHINLSKLDEMKDFIVSPGTILYSSPENLRTYLTVSEGITEIPDPARLAERDIWSLGIILMEMVYGYNPILAETHENMGRGLLSTTIYGDVNDKLNIRRAKAALKAEENYISNKRKGYLRKYAPDTSNSLEQIVFKATSDPSEYSSVSEMIDDLNSQIRPKMTRRMALKIGSGLLGIGGMIVFEKILDNTEENKAPDILEDRNKAEELRLGILDTYEREGKIHGEQIGEFTEAIHTANMLPALRRIVEAMDEKKEYNLTLFKTENGIYHSGPDTIPEAAYFPSLLLLDKEIRKSDEFLDSYFEFINSRSFDPSYGYRSFRHIHPLEEHIQEFSDDNTIEKSKALLNKYKTYLVEERYKKIDDAGFFVSNPSDKIEGYENTLSALSYYIMKNLWDSFPEKCDDHINTIEQILLIDDIAYDKAFFNSLTDLKPGITHKIEEKYENIEINFYPNTYTLSLITDMFADSVSKSGRKEEVLNTLKTKFQNILDQNEEFPEFLNAPDDIRGINNFPLALYFSTMVNHQELFTEEGKNKQAYEVIKRIQTKEEGILPSSRTWMGNSPTCILESDFLTLYNLNKLSTEKTERQKNV